MQKKWDQAEQYLASEIFNWQEKVSKAKNLAIVCMAISMVAIGIGMATINYLNDRDWRELFASYDYVSQDGDGYNYYNSGIEGDVVNGAENPKTEE